MKHLQIKSKEFKLLEIGFSEWLDTLGYSESSRRYLPTTIREFLHYLESKAVTSIKKVTSKEVEKFYERLSTRKNLRRTGGLSQVHLNKSLYALRTFSIYLQKTKQISLFIPISNGKIHREINCILTIEEIQQLLESAENDAIGYRDQAMIAIYYGCGLRLSEGAALKVSDIDTRKGMLVVRKSKNSKQRYVPINSSVLGYIIHYLTHGRPYLLRRSKGKNDSFFISERGETVHSQSLYLRLKRLQKKTQNHELMKKTIGIHTLRHSIATHLLRNKVPIESIGKFLGHTTIDSTQIYLHIMHEGI